MDKEIEISESGKTRMENKKFSELKAGDDFYIWRYNTLIKDRVKDIQTKQSVREIVKDKRKFIGADEICVTLHDCGSFYISYGKNESAMMWGTDGWHEYIILGTSKDTVKTLLQAQLITDAAALEDNTEKWIAEFDK